MHVLIFLTGDGCIGRNAHVCDVKHGEEGLFSFQQDFGTQSSNKHNTTDAFFFFFATKITTTNISFLSLENQKDSAVLPQALGKSCTHTRVFLLFFFFF